MARKLVLAAAAALIAAGCGGESKDGLATGATCPPGATATYVDFGEHFLATYCTKCHASTVVGAARFGAPDHANFDSLAAVRRHIAEIDLHAGRGPTPTTPDMPVVVEAGQPTPTDEERIALSRWLACGAP